MSGTGARDEAWYETAVKQHQPSVMLYMVAAAGQQYAADSVGHAFKELWLRRFEAPHDEQLLHEWLVRIARNSWRTQQRGDERRRQREAACSSMRGPQTSMEDEVTTKFAVQQLLQALPESDRILLGLFYNYDLPTAEIAEMLGTTDETIRQRLCRARKKLQEIADDANFTGDDRQQNEGH